MTSSGEDMIERVAAALYAVDDDVTEAFARERVASWRDEPHQGDCTGIAATCMQCVYQDYTKRARAAIEAMMEPTKPMVFYGMDAMSRDGLEPTEDEFLRGFAAALRSPLSNTEETK